MRAGLCLLLLVLGCFAWGQDTFDTHGKTEAEILKMGMQEWSDFFTSKEGASTASMTEAAGIYGQVAKKRTDKLLETCDAKTKDRTLKLRRLLGSFANSSVDIAYAEAGGGTMYNTMWASVEGVVEDELYALVSKSGSKAKAMVVSMITKELAKLRRQLEEMHRDEKNEELFKYKDARKALAALRTSFDGIVAIAKGLPRADSDRLLQFCYEQAKNADMDSSK